MTKKIKKEYIIISLFVLFNIIIWLSFDRQNDILKVFFLDVGQGDSILIETPNGKKVLIDGGKDMSVISELGRIMGFFDKKIDVVIATHPDKDHIGGLPFVFERYDILNYIDSVADGDTNSYEELNKEILKEKSNYFIGKRGTIIVLDKEKNIYIQILYPDEDDFKIEEINDLSIVTKLVYGDTSFLLTGDAGKMPETMLYINDKDLLRSNVLKAGHHGSKTSSGRSFVEFVMPEYVVISAGENNSYGHPHKEVISLFEELGVNILETAKEGTIKFYSNGIDVWFK